jgi:REP element-mobilizing transposase RayT
MSPSVRIHKNDNRNIYFLTLTVVEWINIFTKRDYFEVLKDSLQYCIDNKGLILYEYVFMTNHIHLIASTTKENDGLDSVIRDFKSFTTHEIWKLLEKDNRKYITRLLKNSLKMKKGSDKQIWQRENYPEELITDEFCNTKIQYIYHNPVKKGYVLDPEDWLYSSARQRLLDLPKNHHEVVLPCAEWDR